MCHLQLAGNSERRRLSTSSFDMDVSSNVYRGEGRPMNHASGPIAGVIRGPNTIWHSRFLGLAEHIAQWSKDGNTKCGAVIVRPNKSIASMGFNGFPQGISDNTDYLRGDPDPQHRVEKLKRIIHAEMNALLFLPERIGLLTMYVFPMLPCHRCAVHIIQAGIATVVARKGGPDRWQDSISLTRQLFHEAGVAVEEIDHVQQDVQDAAARRGLGPPIPADPSGGPGRPNKAPEYDL